MAEQEQRYRVNLTVQPYEDLKTFVGWVLVIALLLFAAAAYVVYLMVVYILVPLLLVAAVAAAGLLVVVAVAAIVRGVAAGTSKGDRGGLGLPRVDTGSSFSVNLTPSLPPAFAEAAKALRECRVCHYVGTPVVYDSLCFPICAFCHNWLDAQQCLNCGAPMWANTTKHVGQVRCERCRGLFCLRCLVGRDDKADRWATKLYGDCPHCGREFLGGPDHVWFAPHEYADLRKKSGKGV